MDEGCTIKADSSKPGHTVHICTARRARSPPANRAQHSHLARYARAHTLPTRGSHARSLDWNFLLTHRVRLRARALAHPTRSDARAQTLDAIAIARSSHPGRARRYRLLRATASGSQFTFRRGAKNSCVLQSHPAAAGTHNSTRPQPSPPPPSPRTYQTDRQIPSQRRARHYTERAPEWTLYTHTDKHTVYQFGTIRVIREWSRSRVQSAHVSSSSTRNGTLWCVWGATDHYHHFTTPSHHHHTHHQHQHQHTIHSFGFVSQLVSWSVNQSVSQSRRWAEDRSSSSEYPVAWITIVDAIRPTIGLEFWIRESAPSSTQCALQASVDFFFFRFRRVNVRNLCVNEITEWA